MIKLRNASYCNLKLILLYLVVYGHCIENQIHTSEILLVQYKIIYMFHMPLFVFLSGLFLRNEHDCLRQMKRMLLIYVVVQSLAIFAGETDEFLTPLWTHWYLLSYCFWTGAAWLWFRFGKERGRWFIFIAAILIGAAAGYALWLDKRLSGSRTVVFFPYFWAGIISNPMTPYHKYRYLGAGALITAIGMMILWGEQIPVSFLYHAKPYGTLENGFALRILCYCIGGLLCYFALTVVPTRRFRCTKFGTDTMPGYLIHAPIVWRLREYKLPWPFYMAFSAFLLYTIYKILQWNAPLYGVVSERRDRGCQSFKKYMKNIANRSTGFFCP